MRTIGITLVAFFLSAGVAAAQSWSALSFSTTPQNAPQLVAATDKLMDSKVGKEFKGKLMLLVSIANGADPATHSFVPIYKTAAEREVFVQKLRDDPAWSEFREVVTRLAEPVSQVVHRTVKSWGDIVDTDQVWMAHVFQVDDAPGFLAALEALMASQTGKDFPGQVYLSEVVAAGISPVSHVISVGYASEAEMESWAKVLDASADWSTYLEASRKSAKYLGADMSRHVKSWGPATMKEISKR